MEPENALRNERLKKLEQIRAMGIEPYGGRFEDREDIGGILSGFAEGKKVRAAGRLSALRSHGKSAFADLRDSTGRIQVYVKEGLVPDADHKLFGLLDLGDFVGVEGGLFKTKTGESTIKVSRITLQAKALRPPPEKWHGLKDTETRFRRRYLDLSSAGEVRELFKQRAKIISSIRSFLDARGYLEVETPMMHPIPGGAAGRPFKTRHEALGADLYLRVAPELYLKKLLVGGFEKVYEINKSFRNEGISTRHNPEFTMLEVYTAYHDVGDVMRLTEELVRHAAREALGSLRVGSGGAVDLEAWRRVSFRELMNKNFGIDEKDDVACWAEKLKAKGVAIAGKDLSRTQIINIVGELLDPGADAPSGPVFVTDYFTELCPLAKRKKDNPALSERFELYVGGMEIANGYSELNDPLEQRERLAEELKEKGKADAAGALDEDFLLALEHGMPPAGGLGIGIDRLVMALCGRETIREVVLFPQLKPENPA